MLKKKKKLLNEAGFRAKQHTWVNRIKENTLKNQETWKETNTAQARILDCEIYQKNLFVRWKFQLSKPANIPLTFVSNGKKKYIKKFLHYLWIIVEICGSFSFTGI